jgi:hypothetical protein
MIKVSFVQGLNYHGPGIAKIFKNSYRFLIYSMGVVVLSDCTVVGIGEFARNIAVVEEVINVDHVNVASLIEGTLVVSSLILLSLLEEWVEVALLPLERQPCPEIMVILVLGPFNPLRIQSSFHEGMTQYLWYRYPVVRLQH